MQDYGSAGSAPALPRGTARVWLSLALLMVAFLVTVPAYSGLPTKALVIAYTDRASPRWAYGRAGCGSVSGSACSQRFRCWPWSRWTPPAI